MKRGTVRPRAGGLRRLIAALLVSGSAVGQTATPPPADSAAPPPQQAPAPAPGAAVAGTPRPLDAIPVATDERPVEPLPDPGRLGPAELVYVNPLFKPIETQARVIERPVPVDYEGRATLMLTLHINETGKVVEGQTVQPPLKGLNQTVAATIPRWTFQPAKKSGAPVATWVALAIDLQISLEKGIFSSFLLTPVGKDDPLPAVARDTSGDAWTARYPKDVTPKDTTVVSIEDVDTMPVAQKTSWSFDATRVRSYVNALVEVSSTGSVRRVVPIGETESAVIAWIRQMAPKWKLAPALSGKPVDSWATLKATLEYTIDSAKDKGKRTLKKNLRGAPAD